MQLWVIHKAKQHACTCLDCCFIFPSAMRAFWNACLTEIDPVVPTHCCSLLSIPQLPPAPSLSFSSSVAELERCLASLVLSSLITYLHSFSLHQHQMKEGAPRPPLLPAPPLSACVCLFHVGCSRGKLRCFVLGDTALSPSFNSG